MKAKILILLLNIIVFSVLAGCRSSDGVSAKAKPIRAVATTGMIADIVREVAQGTSIEVKQLIGEGVDPHLYKPSRSDIAQLTSAEIVFYNGLLLEGKMTDALVRLAGAGKKVFAVTELIEPHFLLEPEQFQGHFDPHVWMDPRAWLQAVTAVEKALIEYLPAEASRFSKNANEYRATLNKLDEYCERVLKLIPEDKRVLVTAHDAFNYFGRRYSLEVVGIQGLSTESEAGVQDIERIVTLLVERKIPSVFVESTVSERNVQALIEGANAQGHRVSIGGSLFSDAMGKPGTYRGTYVGMIDHNVTTVANALGANVSKKGFQGIL
jgi:manganese/zinc/iron transport system substrate-binding protein